MRRRFERFAPVLAWCALACSRQKLEQAPPAPTVRSTASAPVAPSAKATTPSPTAFCEEVRAEHRRQMPDLRPVEPKGPSPDPVLSRELERGGCFAGEWGAWAVELQDLASYPEWRPVFREPDGRKSVLEATDAGQQDPTNVLALYCCGPTSLPRNFALADFDGDARPELVFEHVWSGAEGGERNEYAVYTARAGAIRRYDPGFVFHQVDDVDKDGRLDLIVHAAEEVRLNCADYGYAKVEGPRLLVHGVNGGFSSTDAVAQAYARKECPNRPERIVVKSSAGVVDHAKTARNAVCARAWGMGAKEIDAALTRDCKVPGLHKDCRAAEHAAGECWHLDTLRKWVNATPIVFSQ